MKMYYVLYNPKSDSGKGEAIAHKIDDFLRDLGLDPGKGPYNITKYLKELPTARPSSM